MSTMQTQTLSAQQIESLRRRVIERDGGLCVNCGAQGDHVHHIIPRSRAARNSPKVWREENMCVICLSCHEKGQTKWFRERMLRLMRERHGYYMAWAGQFGICLD